MTKWFLCFIVFCFFLGTTIPVSAQTAEKNTKKILSIKEIIWTRTTDDGRMEVESNGVFRRGETVNLVCREVGTFQPGKDGKCSFDIDMIVKDPSGKIILDQENLLGEKGHIALENNTAGSPYGIYDTNVGMKPGNYRMILTIRDKIGNANVTVTQSFTLSPGLSYRKSIFARKGIDGKLNPVDNATFRRGETVNFILLDVGLLKKGPDGKHFFDIDMEVKNPDDKIVLNQKNMLGQNGNLFLENDIAESPYGIFYTTIDMDPGTYIMQLTIRDKIGNEKLSVTKPFTLQ